MPQENRTTKTYTGTFKSIQIEDQTATLIFTHLKEIPEKKHLEWTDVTKDCKLRWVASTYALGGYYASLEYKGTSILALGSPPHLQVIEGHTFYFKDYRIEKAPTAITSLKVWKRTRG